jgi:diketogulonate reductase-like aldo/keto reductase
MAVSLPRRCDADGAAIRAVDSGSAAMLEWRRMGTAGRYCAFLWVCRPCAAGFCQMTKHQRLRHPVHAMKPTRRMILQGTLAASGAVLLPPRHAQAQSVPMITKPIPSTGERLPVIGLGSWITFNVGNDRQLLDECAAVISTFFEAGGRMIDSSPMYGSSQPTIGYGLKRLGNPRQLFSAEKVWISNASSGPRQIEQSRAYWGVPALDLVQVHNLLSWEKHLETLLDMKAKGEIRYVGITTSEGRRHRDFERVMSTQPIDFAQVTYNVLDREVEARILPLAKERGIAVIVNRPFRQGDLIRRVERNPLPSWANEAGAASWPQFLLKFIVSHPAVTCAIPATSRVDHVRENMVAGTGRLPDEPLRRRMADYVRQL